MTKPEIDVLAENYHSAEDGLRVMLTQTLTQLDEGQKPSREILRRYETGLDSLNACYDSVVSYVRQILLQEEMPPDGSRVSDYVDAYRNSVHRIRTEKLKKIKQVLERFMQVKSALKPYASALQPYQEDAEKSLSAVRKANASGTLEFSEDFCQTEAQELFLQVLAIQDEEMDTEESMSFIQKITDYYPPEVQFGLLRKKYILEETEELNEPEPEEEPEQPEEFEKTDEPEEQEEAYTEPEVPDESERVIHLEEKTIPEEPDEEDEEAEWSPLGAYQTQNLFFHVADERLIKYQSEKNKKFGVKDFRSDMLKFKNSLNPCLVACKDFNGVSAEMLSVLCGNDSSITEFMCAKLESLGYFDSYEIEGYGKLYVLSENKGKQIFMHKDSASYLKAAKLKKMEDFGGRINATADAAVTRIIRMNTFSIVKKIKPDCKIGQVGTSQDTDSFVQVFYDFYGKGRNIMFVNIVGNNIEQYRHLEKEVKNYSAEAVIVIGITRIHARTLTKWLSAFFPEQLKNGRLYYLNFASGVYHRYPSDAIFNITDEANRAEEAPEAPAEPEQPEPQTEPENPELQTEPENPEPVQEETKEISASTEGGDELPGELSQAEFAENPPSEEAVSVFSEEYAENDNLPKETLSAEKYAVYNQNCLEMIAGGKLYCAAAYTRVLSGSFTQFESYYKQIAFAFNDPLANCSYSSDVIFSTYFSNNTEISEYLVIAAVLRNYFSDQCRYDYSIRQLQDAVSTNRIIVENTALGQLIYALQDFKVTYHHGVDSYADYRQKDTRIIEKKIRTIKQEATALYENYVEKKAKESIPHKRLLETKRLIFSKKDDLASCLEAVKNDNRDFLELIEEYLFKDFIKDGCMIQEENIDSKKINGLIDRKWQEAGKHILAEKKTSDLMGSLRTNVFKALQKIAVVLCNYAESVRILSGTSETDENIAYQRIKNTLLKHVNDALDYYLNQEKESSLLTTAGETVVCETLEELRKRIEGSYDEREKHYFYLDFLRNDYILLDEDYMPVLDEIYEVPNLSVLSRIEKHFRAGGVSLEDRLQAILRGEDDYGSARLILAYLKAHSESVRNPELLDTDIDEALLYPRRDMENKRRSFVENLELAQSYGQIDNTQEDVKETLIQIMERWYDWALRTDNYGFFYKILCEINTKIKEDSQSRAVELENHLDMFIAEHPECEENTKLAEAVEKVKSRISVQNYAAAEDLLNRMIDNDLDAGNGYLNEDYLEEFLDEYAANLKDAGSASTVLHLRFSGHNKDIRGATRLIDSWPKRNNTPPSKIKELFTALGFNIKEITPKPPIQGKDHFWASLNCPINGRKSNYKHPVSVFGSEAEEKGFRIISIFGKMDASRLIDTFKEIGNAMHTVVLLDFALSLADRRNLARKAKIEYTGKTFIVIDRVVAVYLARHYSETAVNRMLMAVTMPFAAYQPYVAESSKIMPQEIFMGRKNELEKIESANGINIVYGGRQLGKSALLRMAQKDINLDENGDRAVLVDIRGLNYKSAAKKISEALFDEGILLKESTTEDWDELARIIKNRLRTADEEQKAIPYLLLMMDEADTFIESCEAVDFHPFDALKDIQSIGSGRFKFVIAGLRNIVRFKKNIALSNNRVLTQLSSMTIMPFRTAEARELLEVPLSYLGFRFPDDSKTEMLISTIFGTTNYFPGLLQLYCSKLIEALQKDYAGYDEQEAPPYIIREEHIKKALADSTLVKEIREKFFITLKVGDDDYYYLIALLAAYHYQNNISQDGCSAQEIRNLADSYSISKISSLTNEKITALMEEMRELNVFQQVRKGRYRFSRRSFRQMMGSVQEINEEILDYAIQNGG